MSKKDAKPRWTVHREDDDTVLVSFEHRRKWRFHAFIGDSFESEAQAQGFIDELVKSKAIPNVKYKIRRS